MSRYAVIANPEPLGGGLFVGPVRSRHARKLDAVRSEASSQRACRRANPGAHLHQMVVRVEWMDVDGERARGHEVAS